MVSEAVPEQVPQHAGGLLLREVVAALDPGVHLTVIVQDGGAARRAAPHPRIDQLIVVEPSPGRVESAWERRWNTYVRTGVAEPWFVRRLRESEQALRAVAAADVVDLQWEEHAVLVPWVRRVNPRARVVLTLHDVVSQVAERFRDGVEGSSVRSRLLRARWSWARRRSLAIEARSCGAAPGAHTPDAVAVLSRKDARLLPEGSVPVAVLPPPLGGRHRDVVRAPSAASAELLMVALLSREVNEDALRWFTLRVLPLLHSHHPDLRVRVAGGGAGPELTWLAGEHGVELLGFVPDLDPLLAAAHAVVVPLRRGAGLKFKTVEALSAGVPVVTTSVGAEGVGPGRWFAGVADAPEDFADAVLTVLADQPRAEERSRRARREVFEAYGMRGFREALTRLYGAEAVPPLAPAAHSGGEVSGSERHGGQTVEPEGTRELPEVTVVVPAFNAAATIGRQLDALAHQVGAPPFEVVVADNRSTDGTAATARCWAGAFPCGLRVVGAPARQGVSHARNRGCQQARAEHILICDADDRVQPNWVREMARALQEFPVVGSDAVPVVGGVEQAQESGLHTVFGSVDYVLCGALGIHRSVWAEVGGFDESFPAGHEDVDFCRRLTAHGHPLHPVHSTAILYTQRPDARGQARQAFHYAQGRMLLWTRLAETGVRPPVSFTGSVREAVQVTAGALHGWGRRDGGASAHGLGWAWGTVAGHLRYRVLGRPPAPRLWPSTR